MGNFSYVLLVLQKNKRAVLVNNFLKMIINIKLRNMLFWFMFQFKRYLSERQKLCFQFKICE